MTGTTTHESTQTGGVGGAFDTPDVSLQEGTATTQAPETKPEDNTPPATEPQEPAAGNEPETGTEPITEPGTEPGTTTSEPAPVKSEPIEFFGRTFTLDEFKANATESRTEGIRLAGLNRDREYLVQAQAKRIMELEDAETERPYSELKSKEVINEMEPADRDEYFYKLHKWEDSQAQTKKEREQNRKSYEDYDKQVQSRMADADRIMTAETGQYPKYAESKPYRDDILMKSPYLGNRANTKYDVWLMAMGAMYIDSMAASKQKTAASTAAAKTAAGAVATQTGEGGPTRTVKTGGAGETSDAVAEYTRRRGPAF